MRNYLQVVPKPRKVKMAMEWHGGGPRWMKKSVLLQELVRQLRLVCTGNLSLHPRRRVDAPVRARDGANDQTLHVRGVFRGEGGCFWEGPGYFPLGIVTFLYRR